MWRRVLSGVLADAVTLIYGRVRLNAVACAEARSAFDAGKTTKKGKANA
jgi:hypothetical protein